MARPQRNNVDYFPFYCEDGNKMFYIEETYGNDGFATFIKLLRELAKTNHHYLDLSKHTTLMFLSAKCKVSKETLIAIINDLVDLGKFDKVLWNENQIIWCQDFIDSIQDAYLKRVNNCIDRNGLIQLLQAKGIRKQDKSTPKQSKSNSEVVGNTQSIVEETKEKERESEEKKTLHPLEKLELKPITDKFIKWFNEMRVYHKLTGNIKFLTNDETNNLIELREHYETKDFERAFSTMMQDEFIKKNKILISPSHFLKVENFTKYVA